MMKSDLKKLQRQLGYRAREQQKNKALLSQQICRKFITQPAYQQAEWVMWYVHCRSEVRTLPALTQALSTFQKKIVVPYCTKNKQGERHLGLWRLESVDELLPGTWGILEPPKSRWNEKTRQVDPEQLDLIMVPGVAFDHSGGRLGNGAGYYDRLLSSVRAETVLTGVCFESQMLPGIEMQGHDVFMDYVMTENKIYQGKGR
jgi:5-formyltetrahydrofolate cyclo-ligase